MMNKDQKNYIDFLSSHEAPPAHLATYMQKEINLSFRAKSIVWKFLFFQIIGALFSMSVCPQFGLGLVQGHGITHIFRMIGDWACALFCGSVFLSAGLIVAFIGMKGEELWWIWRRHKFTLVMLPPVLWGALMLTNVSLKLPTETYIYHITWMIGAMLMQSILLQLRSGVYLWQEFHQEA